MEIFIDNVEITITTSYGVSTIESTDINVRQEYIASSYMLSEANISEPITFGGDWSTPGVEVTITYNPETNSADVVLIELDSNISEHTYELTDISLHTLTAQLYLKHRIAPTMIYVDRAELVYNSKFLKVYNRNGYSYSERLGRDSVAFILKNTSKKGKIRYGVINEPKPPLGATKMLTTAFGGSLDDPSKSLNEIVMAEVEEEAGYKVLLNDITYLGQVMVSTQMNQMCHLFMVDVSNHKCTGRTTTDPNELKADVQWLRKRDILKLQDWKAPTILTKYKQCLTTSH